MPWGAARLELGADLPDEPDRLRGGQRLGAEVVHESEVMAELVIGGGILGIHGGGEGRRTWTGLNFQVDDLFAACDVLKAAGGEVLRPPLDTPEEPAHLAMCVDPDGNEIMITRRRVR